MPPPVGTVAGDSGGDFASHLGDHGADCVFRRCRCVRQTTASSPPDHGQPLAGASARTLNLVLCLLVNGQAAATRQRPAGRETTTARRGTTRLPSKRGRRHSHNATRERTPSPADRTSGQPPPGRAGVDERAPGGPPPNVDAIEHEDDRDGKMPRCSTSLSTHPRVRSREVPEPCCLVGMDIKAALLCFLCC